MECWQPFGRPVVPDVYIRNSGSVACSATGSTTSPLRAARRSSTKTSRPSTIGVFEEYWPG